MACFGCPGGFHIEQADCGTMRPPRQTHKAALAPEVPVGSFDLVLTSETSLHPSGEPSRFVTHHTGVIRYERERDGKVFHVGRLAAYRIQAGLAANAGESLFDVCDSHSAELHEVHALLYEPDGHGFK